MFLALPDRISQIISYLLSFVIGSKSNNFLLFSGSKIVRNWVIRKIVKVVSTTLSVVYVIEPGEIDVNYWAFLNQPSNSLL